MLQLLDTKTKNKTISAALDRALACYESGDLAQAGRLAGVAYRASCSLRDDAGISAALVILAASGDPAGRLDLEHAMRNLSYRTDGASLMLIAIATLTIARFDDRAGRPAQAIAGYQKALDRTDQAKRRFAGIGDLVRYRQAGAVASLARDLVGGLMICTL